MPHKSKSEDHTFFKKKCSLLAPNHLILESTKFWGFYVIIFDITNTLWMDL